MFSKQWKTDLVFRVTFHLSSAKFNALNLDKAKILLPSKGFTIKNPVIIGEITKNGPNLS